MPKPSVPLAQQFSSRDGTLGVVDTFVQNGCFTKEGDKVYVQKRPGTTLVHDFGTGTDTQGATYYNGNIYAIYSDIMVHTGTPTSVGATADGWTEAPVPAWYGRSFFTATVFNGNIYVIGGQASQLRPDISYSTDGFVWSQNASAAPFGHRQGHGACVFNGLLWVIGGFQNDSTTTADQNDVWSSPDGATWTQVLATDAGATDRWTPRDNFALIAANNGMYLYGGADGTNVLDDVWFTTDGATWTQVTAAATGVARQTPASFFFQNKLWIVGGYSDPAGTVPIDDVCSSPDGQTWSVTAPVFGVGKSIMGYCVYRDAMWLAAGDEGGVLTTKVYASRDGVTWNSVVPFPTYTARGAPCLIAFRTPTSVTPFRYESLWLLGGNDGATDLQEVWYANLDLVFPATFTMSPVVTGQPYQFNTFLSGTQLLVKNQSNFWVMQAGTMVPVTDTNYPTTTVPGVVVLDLFAYVMEPDGTIHACALEDPFHWPSLQTINADYEDDAGVAIAKYLNYLVAFGQYTTQFFYDAGNPAPGIPISPYQSTNIKIGCAFASTVVSAKNTLIWVGQTKERNWGVYLFNGLQPQKVSTPWVDKVLNVNLNSGAQCWVSGQEGHTFYVIQFLGNTRALVYDMDTGQWGVWQGAVNGDDPPYNFALTEFSAGGDIWFGTLNYGGQIFSASLETYDDAGTAFDLRSQSDKEGDDLQRTFWGQANFYGDLVTGATATLDVSDDDYQSWTTWGTLDLSLTRPYVNRGGSARIRAFRLTQTDSLAARWNSLKFNVSGGES